MLRIPAHSTAETLRPWWHVVSSSLIAQIETAVRCVSCKRQTTCKIRKARIDAERETCPNCTYCKALPSRTHQLQIGRSKQWPSRVKGVADRGEEGDKNEAVTVKTWRMKSYKERLWRGAERLWRGGRKWWKHSVWKLETSERRGKERGKNHCEIGGSAEELSSQQKEQFDVRRTGTAAHISVSFVQKSGAQREKLWSLFMDKCMYVKQKV